MEHLHTHEENAERNSSGRGYSGTLLLLAMVSVLAFTGCGGAAAPSSGALAGANPPGGSQPPSPPPPSPAPPGSAADFATRCAAPGIVKCVGFDSAADIPDGNNGANFGIFASSGNANVMPTIDTTIMASGTGSLKLTVPALAGADTSGSYFTNFSSDLSTQFGEGQTFYVQWRQRFDTPFITTKYAGTVAGGFADGWKQVIIGSGDQPPATPGGAKTLYFSCSALETVTINSFHRQFPQMYNSCTGSHLHGPFNGFEEPFVSPNSNSDFKLQNARVAPFCLYSQGSIPQGNMPVSFFQPAGNCFPYVANEWMTFQVRIQLGPRVADVFQNSFVTLWLARQGGASEVLFNWGPYDLAAGDPATAPNQKFGKVWLLAYNTNRDVAVNNTPTATWYDELIISTSQIADPL